MSAIGTKLTALENRMSKLRSTTPTEAQQQARREKLTDEEQCAAIIGLFRCSVVRFDEGGRVVACPDYERNPEVVKWAEEFEQARRLASALVILLNPDELARAVELLAEGKFLFSMTENGRGEIVDHALISVWNGGSPDKSDTWSIAGAVDLALRAWSAQTGKKKPETLDQLGAWLDEVRDLVVDLDSNSGLNDP